jgi:galactonate dehydratase
VKILPVSVGRGPGDSARRRDAVELTSAVRDVMGAEARVMLDFHGRTSKAAAIRLAAELAQLDPWFIEEPCQPEDVDGLAEVASRITAPVATGERLASKWEAQELLARGACAILQPDLCHVGGFTEMRKIAALAEVAGVALAPHNPLGPIATAANIHFAAATLPQAARRHPPELDAIVTALDVDGSLLDW